MMSMGPAFPPHPPGMQPHPGGPGHPMGAPMAHNPSQPGVQPGSMPHQLVPHMAVSGPGGQMNPGMMGGLPPGPGGPNAHAMSHLNPAGAQMFHNPNLNPMAFATNSPQQMHQFRQQQQLRQAQLVQQQQMQMMQQAGVYGNMGGVPVGGMGGMPMNLQAQQMMLRQRMPMQHAANPQQQAMIAQQVALQQQQQQQQHVNNQMAQQGGHPNHPHLNPQQIQNLQQQQLAQNQQMQVAQAHQAQAHAQQAQAAHVAQAQAQAHAQAQNQGHPQGGPQQPPSQQQQQQSPQAGQPPPQTPQQSQGGPNGPGGNPPMAGQGPNQGAPGPGQPHPPPQPGQQPQPGPPQTPQTQAQQAQAQLQMAAVANSNAMNNMMRMQQMQQHLRGQCILKLVSFAERLNGFSGPKSKDDRSYWDNFVQTFFSENGVFRFCPSVNAGNEPAEKTYDVTAPALPNLFHTQFDSGVKSMQFIMGQTNDQVIQEKYLIEAPKASFVYWYDNGSHVVATGTFKAQFNSQPKLELFEFITTSLEEYISRNAAIEAAKPAHNWHKEWHKVNAPSDSKQSPEMSKKGKAKPMKSPPNPPPEIDLPESAVQEGVGVTRAVAQFLEMVEIMGQMNPLFHYIQQHPAMNPYAALDHLVSAGGPTMNGLPMGMNGIHPNPNMNPNMVMNNNMTNGQPPMQQGGPRTPSFNQFQMGQSPALANQMLPGSPHMGGSPAQGGQMQAPTMQLQASQQGTSSSGPSANTSPSQNSNKRRRPSGVKTEEDGGPVSAPTPNGSSQVNGVQGNKTKPPTPRISNNKRVKVNPS